MFSTVTPLSRAQRQARATIAQVAGLREDVLTERERQLVDATLAIGKQFLATIEALETIAREPGTVMMPPPASPRTVRVVARERIDAILRGLAHTLSTISSARE